MYEAVDLSLGRRVAVKTLTTVGWPHDIARLRREARALAALSHRNLATVYGFLVFRSTPMIIMEYVDGGTLAARIPMPLSAAIDVMLKVTEVVACLHRAGVVHCDIKPRNIGFTGCGEVKLLDFGLASLEKETTMSSTSTRTVVGTPAYLSPEAHACEKANPSFDIWALSVAFYEVLTGRRPFEAESRGELVAAIQNCRWTPIEERLPGCSKIVSGFFEGTLADRKSRPSTAQQLARRLAALRGAE